MFVVRFFKDQLSPRSRFSNALFLRALNDHWEALSTHCDDLCGCKAHLPPTSKTQTSHLPQSRLVHSAVADDIANTVYGKKIEPQDAGPGILFRSTDNDFILCGFPHVCASHRHVITITAQDGSFYLSK
jgi:hypothetical protein